MNKKIAIVHDWLVTNAGAEKVLKSILEVYPDADIFSLVDFLSDKDRGSILNGKYAKTSFIQKLPFARKHFRNYLPLFPKAIESLDLSGYDLIISSSWAVAKGVKKDKSQLHICYCHTPVRYAWDLYDEYTSNLKQPKKFLVQQILQYIRKWDIDTVDRVDFFIANSSFVKKRIERTYGKDAKVIYPPVNVEKFTLCTQKEDFYLIASRLVSYKKIGLIVRAFNEMPDKKLVVIGDGEELAYIKAIAKNNITVLGYQEDDVLVDYMQRAKAFVYAAIEDFGIVPIEAMACGTPVIALDNGGTAETVCEGLNGVHFKKQSQSAIIEAVNRFENLEFDYEKVRESSLKYTFFKEKFREFVDSRCKSFF
jgi:glycosyltransferase involved in cell wall biosynthesis